MIGNLDDLKFERGYPTVETIRKPYDQLDLQRAAQACLDYFGPAAPEGKEKNWIRTVPGQGHFVWIRLYGPLEPFFEQTWRPDDIVKA
jgi:hypothetical protein